MFANFPGADRLPPLPPFKTKTSGDRFLRQERARLSA
jgi:hypothetical protein